MSASHKPLPVARITLSSVALLTAIGCAAEPVAAENTDQASTQTRVANPQADIVITGFVGKVVRVSSPSGPASVQITPGARTLDATIESKDGQSIVRGTQALRNTNCTMRNNTYEVRINGETYREADLPTLTITAPDSVKLDVANSLISGDFGNIGASSIGLLGCAPVSIGAVSGDLELSLAGSGAVETGTVDGDSTINLAGSGSLTTSDVTGALTINVAGSGDTRAATVGGTLDINIAGSGDVVVSGGRNEMAVNIAGSGNVRHQGQAINPRVSIIGSGSVRVARIEGQPNVSRMGSGNLIIGEAGR